ncbi:hypothetical protein EVAR_58106_1 [Eumeta japonica]|uniref:Uncharacterized protein n=1 Tax=Eumeta variegata TaxID=151549 RepID=A0A4C1YN96_EUMVA|nr:hypothetical protein EVAR_58106_1 [Eumeta japonica]
MSTTALLRHDLPQSFRSELRSAPPPWVRPAGDRRRQCDNNVCGRRLNVRREARNQCQRLNRPRLGEMRSINHHPRPRCFDDFAFYLYGAVNITRGHRPLIAADAHPRPFYVGNSAVALIFHGWIRAIQWTTWLQQNKKGSFDHTLTEYGREVAASTVALRQRSENSGGPLPFFSAPSARSPSIIYPNSSQQFVPTFW